MPFGTSAALWKKRLSPRWSVCKGLFPNYPFTGRRRQAYRNASSRRDLSQVRRSIRPTRADNQAHLRCWTQRSQRRPAPARMHRETFHSVCTSGGSLQASSRSFCSASWEAAFGLGGLRSAQPQLTTPSGTRKSFRCRRPAASSPGLVDRPGRTSCFPGACAAPGSASCWSGCRSRRGCLRPPRGSR